MVVNTSDICSGLRVQTQAPLAIGKEMNTDVDRQKATVENAEGPTAQGERNLAELAAEVERLRAEVRQLREDLRRARESKSEFVADVSHELRTPLAVIIGYIEMMLEAPQRPLLPAEEETLRIVLSNSQRLLTLMNDLLDMSQLEAGKFSIEPRLITPTTVLRQVGQAAQVLADRQGLRFSLQIEDDPPLINADDNRLFQVLNNLISNAIKFTPPGGEVQVRACTLRLGGKRDVAVPRGLSLTGGDWLIISVADTGMGIAPEEIPHLFTRFHRSPEAGRKAIQGTGIGLYVAKAIVDAHGGQIGVESEPGKGSIFRVALRALTRDQPGVSR
jgi:signal transduction histidine kinase